ncbi:antitoxin [Eggerthella sinensis]|uniref:antitoxin n=1 Tax=Eggerthella sinensis TaxID=242230 RepID=UPI00266C84B7|nr:antitoxin [Eggerthella sinensis]
MPQLSLYLDEATMGELRKRASLRNTSLSKHVVELIKNDTAAGWPEGYWDLFGSIRDSSFVAPNELSFERDAPRGTF